MSTATARRTTHPAFVTADVRAGHRRWARVGGAAILVGGALLLAATVVEAFLPDDATLLPLFASLFLTSAAVLSAAMLPLALGANGSNGITGTRVRGTHALLGFGAVFFANQTLYYVTTYGAPVDTAPVGWLPLTLGIVQLVLLLVGAIGAVRAGVATGAARWALLALAIVVGVTGSIAAGSADAATVTIALISSCVTQIIVGIVLLTAGPANAASEAKDDGTV